MGYISLTYYNTGRYITDILQYLPHLIRSLSECHTEESVFSNLLCFVNQESVQDGEIADMKYLFEKLLSSGFLEKTSVIPNRQ